MKGTNNGPAVHLKKKIIALLPSQGKISADVYSCIKSGAAFRAVLANADNLCLGAFVRMIARTFFRSHERS